MSDTIQTIQQVLEDAVRRKIRRPLFASLVGDHLRGVVSPTSRFEVCGAMLLPLREVLGLRPLVETKERRVSVNGREVQLTFHDLRRYLDRVAQVSNTRTLEELYSPLTIITGPEHDILRRIGRNFVNRHCYHDYLERARQHLEKLDASAAVPAFHLLEASRLYLAGIQLLTFGVIESNLDTLCERQEAFWLRPFMNRYRTQGDAATLHPEEVRLVRYDLTSLESQLEAARERSSLPETGGSITMLDEFLVDLRLRDLAEPEGPAED